MRLTRRFEEYGVKAVWCRSINDTFLEGESGYEEAEKLSAYEDAEEQGLLIRLPCKVGDDVWTIMCGMTGKHPALFRKEFTLSMFSHFGTAVFLTKEEAEVALAEMEKSDG